MTRILLLLALAGCGQPPATTPTEVTEPAGRRGDIATEGFAAEHAAGVTVIDVRTPREYAGGHVPGAVNVPLDTLDPAAEPLASYPRDEPVYVVCQTGRRSSRAADALAEAGFTAINVEGGTSAWTSAGHPVEK